MRNSSKHKMLLICKTLHEIKKRAEGNYVVKFVLLSKALDNSLLSEYLQRLFYNNLDETEVKDLEKVISLSKKPDVIPLTPEDEKKQVDLKENKSIEVAKQLLKNYLWLKVVTYLYHTF